MTAEIAILNKTAVALAADSAVTLSAGDKEHKIFDSADKLFELSDINPIGVMIYNGMSFAQAPLQSLVRQFRKRSGSFTSVEAATSKFLEFLAEFGAAAPASVQRANIEAICRSFLQSVSDRFSKSFDSYLQDLKLGKPSEDIAVVMERLIDDSLAAYESVLLAARDAEFIGEASVVFENVTFDFGPMIQDALPLANVQQRTRAEVLLRNVLRSEILSPLRTGVVVAGFGAGELFPTLLSYEVDGMVFGRLKVKKTNFIDIDREGTKARVLPFAQKEMVERFLYGLDEQIENLISNFCFDTVSSIRAKLFEQMEFESAESRGSLERRAREAEQAFVEGLRADAFNKIRSQSQIEIEDMVEFMPKPEMAKMAEALVNLTSIKRRVSRGMETVGGPIDVAVISQAEGFVWVKRKHYFPAELNIRYFERVRHAVAEHLTERNDGEGSHS